MEIEFILAILKWAVFKTRSTATFVTNLISRVRF